MAVSLGNGADVTGRASSLSLLAGIAGVLLFLVPAYSLPHVSGSHYAFYVLVAAGLCVPELDRPGWTRFVGAWRRSRLYRHMALLVVSLALVRVASLAGQACIGCLVKLGYFSCTGVILLPVAAITLARREAVGIIRFVAILGVAVSLIGIAEYHLEGNPLYGNLYKDWGAYYTGPNRPASTFGNAIVFGSCLAVVLPFVLAVDGHPAVRVLSVTIVLYGLLLSDSQGAWIAAAVAGALYFGLAPSDGKHALHILRNLLCAGVIVVMAWVWLSALPAGDAQSSLKRYRQSIDRVVSFNITETHRLQQYENTLAILAQHPVLGIGFGRYTAEYEEASQSPGGSGRSRTTENMVLMVAAETGLSGLVVVGALITLITTRPLAILWKALPPEMSGPLRVFVASMGTALCSMLTWDLMADPQMRMLFWLLCGWGVGLAMKANATSVE